MALSLCVRQHGLHGDGVRGMNLDRAAKLALVLGGLLREDVALERLRPLHASGSPDAKALGSAFLRLHLRHDCLLSSNALSGVRRLSPELPLNPLGLSQAPCGARRAPRKPYFFLRGAMTMIICRPSSRGI